MKALLRKPFENFFQAPELETPLSTIKMPSTWVSMPLMLLSFFVISSGIVFCYVNGMPLTGYYRGPDGNPVWTWIDENGLSSQYIGEGLLASMIYTGGACAFIAAFKVLEKRKSGGAAWVWKVLAYSIPVWILASFQMFHRKIPSYFPTFRSR